LDTEKSDENEKKFYLMSLPMVLPTHVACRHGSTPAVKDTSWRRDTYNQSDDELRTAQQQQTTGTQVHRSGSVKDGGHQFEMKMAAVIGLRGLQRDDSFELFSNRDKAGNFDDLVYTAVGRRYFLQLKHGDSPDRKKMTEKSLVELLQKCCKSYCDIKDGSTFKDILVDSSEFIIYTNKELQPTLLKHNRRQREVDIFFKTSDKGEIFSFLPDENRENDVYKQVENAMNQSKEFGNSSNREIVTEFLNKVIIATGQKGRWELDEVIDKEIRKHNVANVDNDVYKTELLEFKTSVEMWCRDKKEKMTATMFRNWLQEAKTKACVSVVSSLFVSCTKCLVTTGIHFADSEVSRLQAELSNNPAVHLRSDAPTLCSILLLDCLDTSKHIFVNFESLQNNKNMLLHALLGGHWEWLIVFCDSTVQPNDISKTCLDICRYITSYTPNKHFIILTACSMQKIDDFFKIDHKFKFEQLSKESQDELLNKTINFQGCEVTLRSVLQRHGNVQQVLGPELVTDLTTEGTTVNIGGTLQEKTGSSAPRGLKRKIYLHLDVLGNSDSYPEIFALSGMEEKDLVELVPSDETTGKFCLHEDSKTGNWNESYNKFNPSRFIILDSKNLSLCFGKLCERNSGKTLHWFKFKNGCLLWKKSRGGIDSLINFVDPERTRGDKRNITEFMKRGSCEVKEESIWDLSERTVLVVAEPGMGKSSTTTQVAWKKKERDPTSWVVRINWNDHTRKLQDIDAATFNLDSLFEFLCSAAFPESKYADIKRSLLRQALQDSGNVTVLMDGFDEICPTYAENAFVVLREMMKTKVRNFWVTSRPVQRERIEKDLSVAAFNLKKLSREWQERMFCDIWKEKATGNNGKLVAYIQDLLKHANETVNHRPLSPLNSIMIASAFEENLERYLETGEKILPGKPEFLHWYDAFVERKLHIYETEKKKEDLTKASVQDDHEILKNIYPENLEKCSLSVTLPYELNPLRDEETQSAIQSFVERIQAGKDKIGIVMNVVEDRLHFIIKHLPSISERTGSTKTLRQTEEHWKIYFRPCIRDHEERVRQDTGKRVSAALCGVRMEHPSSGISITGRV